MIALTAQNGDRRAHVSARIAVADTYIFQGRLDEGRSALFELRTAVDAGGDRAALVRSLMTLARAALARQDYLEMSDYGHEAYRISGEIGDREGQALALHTIANGLVYPFRVAEARAAYRHAAELYMSIGHRVGQASVAVDEGLFCTELGLLDRALILYANAADVAESIGFEWVRCIEAVNAA